MNKITILNPANVPMGPFTREQVLEKLQRGEVTLSSLAFVEGLSQWTPLRDVMPRVEAVAPTISIVPPVTKPASVPAVAAYSYAATMEPPPHLVYAGFWIRCAAYLIDGIILTGVLTIASMIVILPISFVLAAAKNAGADSSAGQVSPGTVVLIFFAEAVFYFVVFLAIWLYFAVLESSRWQATLGKRLLGLRVIGMNGTRIGFGRATGRFFGKWISGVILYIGFIMAGFTERKQALHDMLAGTLVVKN